tara:strand:- start:381 stop:611 length:231 start_codon:yes stop_codon:yes gene_type:complete
MRYEILIKSVSEIINNELIYKEGLELVYKLSAKKHKKLSEHFFYKINSDTNEVFEHTEEFEVEMGGIIIKFVIDEE